MHRIRTNQQITEFPDLIPEKSLVPSQIEIYLDPNTIHTPNFTAGII